MTEEIIKIKAYLLKINKKFDRLEALITDAYNIKKENDNLKEKIKNLEEENINNEKIKRENEFYEHFMAGCVNEIITEANTNEKNILG
jgi:aspartate oxidase